MRLWLVRHGETEANVAGLYSGHAPTPLTEKGIAQAQTLNNLLRNVPFDNVFCSELERARHTARLVLHDRDVPQRLFPGLTRCFWRLGDASSPRSEPRRRSKLRGLVYRLAERRPDQWGRLPGILTTRRALYCTTF